MYTLHAVPDWASLAVRLVLEEAGVDYRVVLHDPEGGDRDAPAYRALHPLGKIPALETPDGAMIETGAILLWLGERHGLAPAPDSPERAAFLAWFVFVNANVHTAAMHLLHPYRPAGEGQAAEVGAWGRAQLVEALTALEAMVAAKAPAWLSPREPSVLGYYLAMLMRWGQAFPFDSAQTVRVADFPHLHAIARALEARPAARRVADREGLAGAFLSDPQG